MTDHDKPDSIRAPHDVRELHEFREELVAELGLAEESGDEVRVAEIRATLAKINEQAAEAERVRFAALAGDPRRHDTSALAGRAVDYTALAGTQAAKADGNK